jgi:hypothetical protein
MAHPHQLAVGFTHVLRGNAVGAVQLLRRTADHVEGYANEPPHGLDTVGPVVWARALAVRVETDGLGGLTPGISSHTFDLMWDGRHV